MHWARLFLVGCPLVLAAQNTPLRPDTNSQRQPQNPRPFLKTFSLESFGFTSAVTGQGFENSTLLSGPGAAAAAGLQCPYCIVRPAIDRTRYTHPAFAGRSVWRPMQGRAEFAAAQGAVNAYRPDNSIIMPDRRTSFNDDWLLQHWVSAAYALDSGKHFWLGALRRNTVRTNAPDGPMKSWKSMEGTLNMLWGR